MKSVFTPKYVMDNRGCYSEEQAEKLSFIKQNEITIADIMNSEIPMKDKRWWFINACEMTTKNRIDLALILARVVLPIYENKYPNDKRVRECLDAIDDFNAGKITRDDLLAKRRDAAYAADAADAAGTAAARVVVACPETKLECANIVREHIGYTTIYKAFLKITGEVQAS